MRLVTTSKRGSARLVKEVREKMVAQALSATIALQAPSQDLRPIAHDNSLNSSVLDVLEAIDVIGRLVQSSSSQRNYCGLVEEALRAGGVQRHPQGVGQGPADFSSGGPSTQANVSLIG
ncbi:hypothetical protein ABBQ32_005372 [Trebouxia sp. C0010 RCD-2024]